VPNVEEPIGLRGEPREDFATGSGQVRLTQLGRYLRVSTWFMQPAKEALFKESCAGGFGNGRFRC